MRYPKGSWTWGLDAWATDLIINRDFKGSNPNRYCSIKQNNIFFKNRKTSQWNRTENPDGDPQNITAPSEKSRGITN